MFDRPVFETQPDHFEDTEYYKDPLTDRIYMKVVGGICPPNVNNSGYIVLAGLGYPESGQKPLIWLISEQAYNDIDEMMLAMSRAHNHFRVSAHYARFKRSKNDDRVYDDLLRHIQRFNLESVGERRTHLVVQDAPWTNDRGHLKFFLEKLKSELQVGKRSIYWNEPSPPSIMSLNGIDEWELVKDDHTMLGALCYAIAGLLLDRPQFDRTGRVHGGYGKATMKGKFNPTHTLDSVLKQRRK